MQTTHKARSWRRKLLRAAVIYAVVPYVTVTVIFTLAQRRLMYRPSVADTLLASELNLDTQHILDVHLDTTDGDLLKGWLLKRQVTSASTRGLVIYLVLDRWPSIDRIPYVTCPITVLHGAEDEMVPVSEARALAAASAHATFLEIPGAGHNDVPSQALKKLLEI